MLPNAHAAPRCLCHRPEAGLNDYRETTCNDSTTLLGPLCQLAVC